MAELELGEPTRLFLLLGLVSAVPKLRVRSTVRMQALRYPSGLRYRVGC
jgi:hypothetical protein